MNEFVVMKPNTSFARNTLNAWGTGQIIGNEWAGILFLEVPYHPDKFVVGDPIDPQVGAYSIRAKINRDLTLTRSNTHGGHLHSDGAIVSLWYKCSLRQDEYELA